jgi:ABC-type nitrate/sulfonate/bicarbonate transport system permease component
MARTGGAGQGQAGQGQRRRAPTFEAAVLPLAGIAVVLGFFEVAPRVGVLPRSSFPTTSEVGATLADMLGTAEPWRAAGRTLGSWARAMGFATLVAVPLGLAMGASRTVALIFRFTVEFLRPIPSVALIPALVLVYHTHSSLAVALGAYAAAFPLLFQAMYGVADIDPVATDMGRVLGLGWFVRVRHIVVPSCAPYLATGLRISASVALILVVTGEYVVGVPGLGQKVLVAQNGGAYDRAYAWVVVTGVLGWLVNLAFGAVERHYLRWHPSQRGRSDRLGRHDEAAGAL